MTYIEFLAQLDPEVASQTQNHYSNVNPFTGTGYGGQQSQPYDPNNPYGHINPYAYSGMSREDMPADKLYAQLTRAQLRDYQERFQPVEDFLAANITATGTEQLEADLERTSGAVIQNSDNVRGQSQRFRERYGLSAREQTTASKNQTASTMVGGLNMTRARDADRKDQLLTGGIGAIGNSARSAG